jgi:hypothetical protein
MVVSRLPAGCRVCASASRPLDSVSTATSGQNPFWRDNCLHSWPLLTTTSQTDARVKETETHFCFLTL